MLCFRPREISNSYILSESALCPPLLHIFGVFFSIPCFTACLGSRDEGRAVPGGCTRRCVGGGAAEEGTAGGSSGVSSQMIHCYTACVCSSYHWMACTIQPLSAVFSLLSPVPGSQRCPYTVSSSSCHPLPLPCLLPLTYPASVFTFRSKS